MADLGGVRRALRSALSELDPILAKDKPATPDALARALHALCRAQLAMLSEASRREGDGDRDEHTARRAPTPTGPIPPERLMDDDDEPTVMLAEAIPLGDSDDDDGTQQDDGGDDPADGAEPRAAAAAHCRTALERFELLDLNRWLGSGTLFQMRGDMAYLNLAASTRIGFDFRVKLRELGFARELGLLDDPELTGQVLLFKKP